jgi:hypothetical protein
MAVVKCLMMQKDEELVLEPWIRYTGYLFGFENLYVFDNGSTKETVLATLNFYKGNGIKVYTHLSTTEDWLAKGDHFAAFIRYLDATEDYDIVLLLDCDEFVGLYTESGVTCDRGAIHCYLDRLIGTRDVLGMYSTLFNVPGRPGWFWPQRGAKRFFCRDTIGTLDHGYHVGTSRKSDRVFETDLAHLHYHHKPYAMVVEHAARKLSPFVDVTDRAALAGFTEPGSHLVRHFFVDEKTYGAQFDDQLLFYFDGLAKVLTLLGIRSELLNPPGSIGQFGSDADGLVITSAAIRAAGGRQPVRFDGAAYRAANPGMESFPGAAAAHFLSYGYSEGRAIGNRP